MHNLLNQTGLGMVLFPILHGNVCHIHVVRLLVCILWFTRYCVVRFILLLIFRMLSVIDSSAEAIERVSLLAIAWDRKVQVAKLVKSELKVNEKWSLESAAIGILWLDDQVFISSFS